MELYNNEQIKPIPGFENYLITSFGRVWSTKKEQWLKGDPKGSQNGYLRITLYNKGIPKHFMIHRLVAENFLPNPDNLPIVNHKDENKTNNNVDNLEWCTYEYNSNYGIGTQKSVQSRKESGYIKKIWKCDLKTHERLELFESRADANESLGKDRKSVAIWNCLNGISQSAYGYYWEYDN